MKRKIFKIFAFVVFAQITLYACCGDEFNVFMNGVSTTINDTADDDVNLVRSEDFSLFVEPSYETQIISSLSKNSGLIHMAYATSCNDVFYQINLITAIKVEANVSLFGIPAGESLNERILINPQYDDTITLMVNELILRLNESAGFDYGFFFKFDTEIPADTIANFTVTFTLEDNQQFINTTENVTFE